MHRDDLEMIMMDPKNEMSAVEITWDDSSPTDFELEPIAAAALPSPMAPTRPVQPTAFVPKALRAVLVAPAGQERDWMASELHCAGVAMWCVESSAQLQWLLARENPDVILVRAQLADQHLVDIMQTQAAQRSRRPVIVVGLCTDHSRARWLQMGASHCVPMPADLATFGMHLLSAFATRAA